MRGSLRFYTFILWISPNLAKYTYLPTITTWATFFFCCWSGRRVHSQSPTKPDYELLIMVSWMKTSIRPLLWVHNLSSVFLVLAKGGGGEKRWGTYSRSCFLADARFALHGFPAAAASERATESDRRDGALDALDEDLFGFFVAFFFFCFVFCFPPPLFSACGFGRWKL
jgi:hypothetical protein